MNLHLMPLCIGLLCFASLESQFEVFAQETSQSIDFVRDIQPILRDNCYEYHAGTTEEGGLNLGVKSKAM